MGEDTPGGGRSVVVMVAAFVGAPVLLVMLLVLLISGSTPPPCPGAGGAAPAGLGPLAPSGIPVAYVALIQTAGTVCPAVPAPVLAAQLKQESGFNPRAVSPSGAQGIAQFMPGTWPVYGHGDPFDPAAAIPAQARYDCDLAARITTAQATGQLHLTVSVTEAVLFGYNAGLGAVLASGTGVPTNAQSASYVPAIMGMARAVFSATGVGPVAPAPPPTAGTPPAAGGGAGVLAAGSTCTTPGGVTQVAFPTTGGGPAAQKVIAAARSGLGLPYVWGGGNYGGPTGGGFDCSGLTSYAFHQVGIDLPRVSDAQYGATAGTRLPGGFTPALYQPGDLLFWGTPSNIHHVAIAIGGGQLIEAPDFGQLVSIRPIYQADFFAATRPLGAAAPKAVTAP